MLETQEGLRENTSHNPRTRTLRIKISMKYSTEGLEQSPSGKTCNSARMYTERIRPSAYGLVPPEKSVLKPKLGLANPIAKFGTSPFRTPQNILEPVLRKASSANPLDIVKLGKTQSNTSAQFISSNRLIIDENGRVGIRKLSSDLPLLTSNKSLKKTGNMQNAIIKNLLNSAKDSGNNNIPLHMRLKSTGSNLRQVQAPYVSKESSLKLRLDKAKCKEEEIGKDILYLMKVCSNKKQSNPLDSTSKSTNRHSGTPVTVREQFGMTTPNREDRTPSNKKVETIKNNLKMLSKFDSPALFEVRKKQVRAAGFEQDTTETSLFDDTIKDDIDTTHFSIVSSLNYKALDRSLSLQDSSTSEKSAERSRNFIVRTGRKKTQRLNFSESPNKETIDKETADNDNNEPILYNKLDPSPRLFTMNCESTPTQRYLAGKLRLQIAEENEILGGYSSRSDIDDEPPATENKIQGKIIRWKKGAFIGSGCSGQVYRAMEVDTGRIIAVKKIPLAHAVSSDALRNLESELGVLKRLKHQNIVEYLGHELIDNTNYIYMEYVAGGSIPCIYSKYGALTESTIKVYTRQILQGLEYLHKNHVVHKDVKGANILIDRDGTVKLSDFGCSSEVERTLSTTKVLINDPLKGSVPWMAPEVIKETGCGRRADIWALGCTVLEMATGKTPWSQYNYDNHITLLVKIALSDEIPEIPDHLSDDLKDFVRTCLKRDPAERPYAEKLLGHIFLKK